MLISQARNKARVFKKEAQKKHGRFRRKSGASPDIGARALESQVRQMQSKPGKHKGIAKVLFSISGITEGTDVG